MTKKPLLGDVMMLPVNRPLMPGDRPLYEETGGVVRDEQVDVRFRQASEADRNEIKRWLACTYNMGLADGRAGD